MGQRRVVITGIGLISPLGNTVQENWEAVLSGRSGIGLITRFDPENLSVKIAGEVKGFDEGHFFEKIEKIEKKEQKKMDRFIKYGLAASIEAMEDAGLKITPEISNRVGVIVGSGIGGIETMEHTAEVYKSRGPRRISPFFIPAMIANLCAGQIAICFQARGPNFSISSACSSANHSIGEAFHLIQRGVCDAVITGGAEACITPLAISGFAAMRALSTWSGEPEKASRPFDAERSGFVISEGAGILILEDFDLAVRRGARIYAEVAGYGLSCDAYHITAPRIEGAVYAMQMALDDAGISPSKIDYINAHGTSTKLNDANETAAIKEVFGKNTRVPVSSTKSMTGHLLGAAGAIESAFCALALFHGMLPPTINYTTLDPACDLDYVPNHARKQEIRYALNNAFGFGGTNASLIFCRV